VGVQTELDRAIDAHAEATFAFLEALVRAPSTVGREQAAMDVLPRKRQRSGSSSHGCLFQTSP
jgi:acetylornithine deacetylase